MRYFIFFLIAFCLKTNSSAQDILKSGIVTNSMGGHYSVSPGISYFPISIRDSLDLDSSEGKEFYFTLYRSYHYSMGNRTHDTFQLVEKNNRVHLTGDYFQLGNTKDTFHFEDQVILDFNLKKEQILKIEAKSNHEPFKELSLEYQIDSIGTARFENSNEYEVHYLKTNSAIRTGRSCHRSFYNIKGLGSSFGLLAGIDQMFISNFGGWFDLVTICNRDSLLFLCTKERGEYIKPPYCDYNNVMDGFYRYAKATVDRINLQKIKTYPNPVKDELYFEANHIGKYQIFSSTGQVFQEGDLKGNSIKLKDIMPGVYYLKFQEKGLQFVSKFVVID